MYTFEIEWKGRTYVGEWHDETDFENLDNVSGAAGFVFDDKMKLCLIKVSKKGIWTLVGGGREDYDKNFEDILIRETQEEADLDLKEITRLGYIKSFPKDNPEEVKIQLRFVARVKKVKPQTMDPAENEIPERIFINPKDFDKYAHWGENGEFQLKKALEKIRREEK